MGFKYIDSIATPENVDKLLTLVDKVAGVRVETNNVFDIEDALGSVDTINATKLKPKQIRQIPNNIRQFCQNG